MYLVVGATGPVGLGGEICRLLREAGKPVRALVRPTTDAVRVTRLQELGVDLVQGDLKDPASLHTACTGVQTVIATVTTTLSHQPDDTIDAVDGEGQLALVDIAIQEIDILKSGGWAYLCVTS